MHVSPEPVSSPVVDSVACIIPTVSSPYVSLQSHLDTISLYEPVCVNEFAPVERRLYINNLSLYECVWHMEVPLVLSLTFGK